MHIHKINSTSQEHQSFLAQNRIDPITGDSILEGDEVVFCASCKSVFLCDTWEYLGKQHCEQTETLVEFPFTISKLDLTSKENIIFYSFLPVDDEGKSYIPNLNHSVWNTKIRELSKYHYFFNDTPIYVIGILGTFLGFIASYSTESMYPALYSLFFLLFLFVSSYVHNTVYGKKLKTIHKEFKNNMFFFSSTHIGFSKRYGIKEFILSSIHINSLKFYFSSFRKDNFCVIEDTKQEITKFPIYNLLEEDETVFLRSLNILANTCSVSIHLKVYSDYTIYNDLEFLIGNNNYRIAVYKE